LGQIQYEVRLSRSLSDLRRYFDRVQRLRRTYLDDFDLQLLTADVQDAIIERARSLRDESNALDFDDDTPEDVPLSTIPLERQPRYHGAAEIPPEVPRLDRKNWQRAIYLALLFTALICAAFFYLIQTARKINLPEAAPGNTTLPAQQSAGQPGQNTAAVPVVAAKPTLRLYTDLTPGTVSIDDGAPQEIKDGELVLDNLQQGSHTVRVNGKSGTADFRFDVTDKTAPQIVGVPNAVDALAVLVSAQDGKGRIVTNADHPSLILDGKTVGAVGPEGLALDQLGNTDHDLQLARERDRQRFVLTYTAAPVLTAFVKSDPNIGVIVVRTGHDGVNVFINDKPYRRMTAEGQVRIPLKTGQYTIRVHKEGFVDPLPQTAEVKKAEDTAVEFKMEAVSQFGTLQVRGAVPGTTIYIDKQLAATVGNDGTASLENVKAGEHMVELRQHDAIPKRLLRIFGAGAPVVLSGADVQLEKVVTSANSASPPPPAAAPPAETTPAPTVTTLQESEQVRKGGGFVHYATPKAAGQYSFEAHGKLGGFLKRGKLQWYAGYHDTDNYVLFTLDGKRAIVREVQGGKSTEVNRIPFDADSDAWVQVEMSVKPTGISARIRKPDGTWSELGSVATPGRDFTQDKVGFYIPGNDEITISKFRFSSH
jgi:hypothetical protein